MDMYDAGGIFAFLAAYLIILFVILAAVYVVSSLGFFKLFKLTDNWADKAWMAWVPIANILILAWFLADENECPEWQKWFMSFYWLASIIPIVGGIVSLVGAIFVIINYFKFMGKYDAPTWHYVMIFIFPIILPWLWQGYFNGNGGNGSNGGYAGTYEGYSQEPQHTGRRVYH